MRYTDEVLDAMGRMGDPTADAAIASVEIADLNGVLRHVVENTRSVPSDLPSKVARWLDRTMRLPEDIDHDKIDRATAFFARRAFSIGLILSTSSLLELYACRRMAKVLGFTDRLSGSALRRVAETAQFVLFVEEPDGLHVTGSGLAAVMKVRLVHAGVRRLIRGTGLWDEDGLGPPISVEDLAATLMTFSWVVLRDLPKLGIEVEREDAEAHFYLWNVVGELLGIPRDVLPATIDEGHELFEQVAQRHQAPTWDGARNANALLDFHHDLIPGTLFDGVATAVMRHLIGDRLADWLELPNSGWRAFVDHQDVVGAWDWVVRRWGMNLLDRKLMEFAGYKRAAFEIPDRLGTIWDVAEPEWRTR